MGPENPPAFLSPENLQSRHEDTSRLIGTIAKGAALLKLKKVELLGFKSFCEKTVITFSGTGLTCIVGPNGCGKSNIVDAISWVLGEQSHKSLRAERMADCIFNGTQKRPPMGLSEVSLTLVDPELAEAAERIMAEANEGEEAKETEEHPAAESAAEDGADSSASSTTSTSLPSPADSLADEQASERRRKKPPRPEMKLKPGEIVIGRRLYRSGQSEYLINGRVARLRDIQEIFMGTGLGPDSYAIIEQGRIGQILSSKPMDRRAIIEEAAGVTKYKTKRRLAEAKLESSKLNLSRVNDILVEVEKQLGSLKRQASKARRYSEIREQMRGIQKQVLGSRAAALDAEAERLAQLVREINEVEAQETQRIAALDAEQHQLAARNFELESSLRQNQNLLGQHALELDRAENRIVFNRERARELEARSLQLAAGLDSVRRQAADAEARARAHEQNVAALRIACDELEAVLQQAGAALEGSVAEQAATEARIEELRQRAGRLGEEITRLYGEHAQAAEGLAHHREALERAEQAGQQMDAEAARLRSQAHGAENAWQAAEAAARELEQAVRAAQSRIAGLRAEKEQTHARAERTRDELAAARARRSTLEQILNDRAYTAEAVQKLFAANGEGENRGFRAVGVLADYAEVEEKYEVAVEQFLRDELEYVVVETFDHARAGIALLREEMGGRATFFVDSLRHLKLAEGEPPAPFHADAGVVSRLDKLVDFRDPLGAAAKQFLPKLQAAYLVETSTVAEQMARANPRFHFVTPDGTCYHGRMVSGGRPGEAGPLAMKRELRALEAQATQLQREAEEAQAALRWLGDEMNEQERRLREVAAQHLEAEKTLVAAAHERDVARAELVRAEQALAEGRNEIARLKAEADAALERARLAEARQAEAARSRTAAEAETAQAAERLAALRLEIHARQEELAGRRAEMATLAERLGSAESVAERMAAELRELRERQRMLAEQRAALEQEHVELAASTSTLEGRVESLRAEKERLEQSRAALEQEWEQARVRSVEVDDVLRLARQKLGDLREQRSQHEVERARNESDRNHLREICLADLSAHPEDLIAQMAPEEFLTGESLATAEAGYREMRTKIEAMGPVNMMALEEYQECEQRFDFLTRERDDLVKSIEDTLATIRELDEVSRQRFESAFQVINANFAEVFRTLFGGGHAEMRLGETDGTGDPGIDMIAQPPGKRLQNVLLLSGGEKALTALALLIAIFRYQPSPFCILDEVDAPLDEANVGRFGKLISEMSEKTQFIVVTHNKRTMEMAPVLYGVTMQEPGVSKLVSVRWDDPAADAQPSAA
jgi:chromosome segregation protein